MKKTKLLITTLLLALSVTACSLPVKKTAEAPSIPGISEEDYKNVKIYTYESKGVEDSTSMYMLSIQPDDVTATLHISTDYKEDYTVAYTYKGTVEISDDQIVFKYKNGAESADEDGGFTSTFLFDGQEITGLLDTYTDMIKSIAGSYKGTDDAMGSLVLSIDEAGVAKLITDDGQFEGSIYKYDESEHYNFTYYSDDESGQGSIDWIVSFDGDQFTHEDYYHYLYGDYAGTLTAVGELGELDFTLEEDGSCSVVVEYNGQTLYFTGSFSVNSDAHTVESMYLQTEEGHSMSLDIVDLGEVLNYSGNLSFPLSAG